MKVNFGNSITRNNFLKKIGLTQIPKEDQLETAKKRAHQTNVAIGKSLGIGAASALMTGVAFKAKQINNPISKAINVGAIIALATLDVLMLKDTIKNVKNFNETGKI